MDTDSNAVKRIPPHSLDAERSVIGSMIMSGDAIMTASEMLGSEHFYARQYGVFFDALISIFNSGKPVDSVTILEKLKEMQAPPEIRNARFIAELIESVPSSVNIATYAGIVRDNALKRELIRINERIAASCYEGADSTEDILEQAEKEIFDLIQRRGSTEGLVPISSIVMDVLDNIQKAQKSGSRVTGIETGFREIDRMTAGLQKSNLILIAARPSMGKTALALNIAEYAAFRKEKTVIIFSLEMSKEDLVNRLIAMESYVDASKIRIGDIQEKEWEQVIASASIIGRSKLVIDDTAAISVAEMRTRCRRLKVESGLDMVMVDYLQLMSAGNTRKDAGRQQEISDISRSLKALARELNVPVVALSQLSRAVEQRTDKRPMLSDLRESGAIEQDADVVMFIYRDDYYHPDTEDKNIADIIIAKQRNGSVGTKKLLWRPEQTKFMDIEPHTQEE
ncbi:MAG: replicative DNA helicase [Lachnospiraceae bacterium]|nr:replicative DNA helicase [Lachnospiraceae bacterium]